LRNCSSVSVVTRTTGVRFPAVAGTVSPRHYIQTGSGAIKRPIHWVPQLICRG